MRITNQMLARTAAKTGIPLQQNTLLDIMNKRDSVTQNPIFASGNTKKADSLLQTMGQKGNRQLETAAESLSDYASKLSGEGADSLFAKAQATGDTSELVSGIIGMTDAYNRTLGHMGKSDLALNRFYEQELKRCVSENSAALKAVGITKNKDGSLSVQQDALKSANVDSLKAAFGSDSRFLEKIGYVSGRVAENASAALADGFGGYDARGLDQWNTFLQSRYNVWG